MKKKRESGKEKKEKGRKSYLKLRYGHRFGLIIRFHRRQNHRLEEEWEGKK